MLFLCVGIRDWRCVCSSKTVLLSDEFNLMGGMWEVDFVSSCFVRAFNHRLRISTVGAHL